MAIQHRPKGSVIPTGGSGLPRWVPRYRRNLWLLLVACLFAFTALGIQGLILNLYLVTLGYREDFLGLFAFANTAGIGLAALLAGSATNRFGSRRTLVGACVVFAVSSAVLVLTPDPILLLAISVLNGASLAHIFVPCATYVMDNAGPDERPVAYAGYYAAQSAAFVVGSYLGGVLPTILDPATEATRAGYAGTLVVAAAFGFLGAAPLAIANDRSAEGSQTAAIGPGPRAGRPNQQRRDVFWLIAANALIALAIGFVVPFLNVYFSSQLGASTDQIGIIFALGSLAMVFSSILGPALGRRIGIVPSVAAGRLIAAPIIGLMGLSPTIGVAASLYILRIFFTNLTWPVDNAFTMELVHPKMRATLAGLRSASWNFAWALASAVGGVLIVASGFLPVFLISAGFMAVGSLAYYFAFRRRTATPTSAEPVLASPPAIADP